MVEQAVGSMAKSKENATDAILVSDEEPSDAGVSTRKPSGSASGGRDDVSADSVSPTAMASKSAATFPWGVVGAGLAVFAFLTALVGVVITLSRPVADTTDLQIAIGGLRANLDRLERDFGALDEDTQSNRINTVELKSAEDTIRSQLAALAIDVQELSQQLPRLPSTDEQTTTTAALNRLPAAVDSSLSPRLVGVEESVARLSQTNVQLVTRVGALEAALNALQADVDGQVPAMADIERTISALQSDLASQQETIETVRQTANSLRSTVGQTADFQAESYARQLSVARLRDALVSGVGVRAESNALVALSQQDEALTEILRTLSTLDDAAQVPTVDSLQKRFSALWDDIQLQAELAASGDNPAAQAWTRAKNLFSVRRVDGEAEILAMAGVPGQLARTNFYLREGKLQQAVAALSALDGEPAKQAQGFLSDLTNRAMYDDLLQALDRWSLAQVTISAEQ